MEKRLSDALYNKMASVLTQEQKDLIVRQITLSNNIKWMNADRVTINPVTMPQWLEAMHPLRDLYEVFNEHFPEAKPYHIALFFSKFQERNKKESQ